MLPQFLLWSAWLTATMSYAASDMSKSDQPDLKDLTSPESSQSSYQTTEKATLEGSRTMADIAKCRMESALDLTLTSNPAIELTTITTPTHGNIKDGDDTGINAVVSRKKDDYVCIAAFVGGGSQVPAMLAAYFLTVEGMCEAGDFLQLARNTMDARGRNDPYQVVVGVSTMTLKVWKVSNLIIKHLIETRSACRDILARQNDSRIEARPTMPTDTKAEPSTQPPDATSFDCTPFDKTKPLTLAPHPE